MHNMQLQDWFMMGLVSAGWSAGTVYLFMHHSDINFATWATLVVTIGGIFHWIVVRDQKIPDACGDKNGHS